MASLKGFLKNFGVTVILGCVSLASAYVTVLYILLSLLLWKLLLKEERSSGQRKKPGTERKHGNGCRGS